MRFLLFLLTTFHFQMAHAMDSTSDSKHHCKKEDNSSYLQKELSLTDKQKELVKQLHEKYAPELEAKNKVMKTLNEELIAKLQTPTKGPEANTALMQQFKKYQAARNELYSTRFEIALKTRDLLTNEQIKKYQAFYHFKSKDEAKDK